MVGWLMVVWLFRSSAEPVHLKSPQKMAIYIKSTISKLENSRNMLEIVFLCRTTLNMLNFKRLALIATEM